MNRRATNRVHVKVQNNGACNVSGFYNGDKEVFVSKS